MHDNTQDNHVRQHDQSALNSSESAQQDRPDHDTPREVLDVMGWVDTPGGCGTTIWTCDGVDGEEPSVAWVRRGAVQFADGWITAAELRAFAALAEESKP
jgi:hypothetical protein